MLVDGRKVGFFRESTTKCGFSKQPSTLTAEFGAPKNGALQDGGGDRWHDLPVMRQVHHRKAPRPTRRPLRLRQPPGLGFHFVPVEVEVAFDSMELV